MSRILVQRLQRRGFQDQQCRLKSFFHTSSQIDAAAAAALKAQPEQSKPVEAADAKKSGDSKAVATPAKPPSEKVLRLVNELADLSIVDFVDLTEQLKNRLGLNNTNISVPMMMPAGMMMPGMGAAAPAAAAAPAEEEKPVEKQVFDIKLEKYEAADKIKVIKEVRAFTSLGLKEAKDLVDKLPAIVKKSVTKDEAAAILAKLKAAGGHAIME